MSEVCAICIRFALEVFFLILDLGQDSMTIFNISKESVRDKCIIAPEGRVHNAVHAREPRSRCRDL